MYRRLGGDNQLMEKVVGRFCANLPILLSRLNMALKSQDGLRAATQITTLNEVAKVLDATSIVLSLARLQDALHATPPEQWAELVYQVELAGSQFSDLLKQRFGHTVQPLDKPYP